MGGSGVVEGIEVPTLHEARAEVMQIEMLGGPQGPQHNMRITFLLSMDVMSQGPIIPRKTKGIWYNTDYINIRY